MTTAADVGWSADDVMDRRLPRAGDAMTTPRDPRTGRFISRRDEAARRLDERLSRDPWYLCQRILADLRRRT